MQLEMDLAGKTNAAFVFIKPHACNDKVKALLSEHFKKRGIRITGEGTLDAATIDKELVRHCSLPLAEFTRDVDKDFARPLTTDPPIRSLTYRPTR
jgi:hypothetical protein